MPTHPTVEEAVERARRVQDARIEAIRGLAQARQHLADVREEAAKKVADAEHEDVRHYNAALAAGWTADELRKIGYAEPEKKTRARRRSTPRSPATATATTPEPHDAAAGPASEEQQ